MNLTLRQLLDCASGRNIPTEFENQGYDFEAALRDELKKLCGSWYDYQRNKYQLFELISESIDEVLPKYIEDAIGSFAQIMTVPQGARCTFVTKLGRMRARQFITRATNAGTYETFRLDRGQFDLYPHTYAGAAVLDFERYLDGLEDLAELYDIIIESISIAIYGEIQTALINSFNDTGRPAANKVTVNAFDASELQALCNTVAAYGSPVVYCTPQFAATLLNAVTYSSTVKIGDKDVEDIRERGYIGKFRGFPVVVLPQSFADEKNTKLVFNPRYAYVIPAGKEKIVKVAFEGATIIDEFVNPGDRSREVQVYKKLAAGIVSTPNYWGIYYNSGITAGGW